MKYPYKGEVFVDLNIRGEHELIRSFNIAAPVPSEAAHAAALIIREALTIKQARQVLAAVKKAL